MKSIDEVTAISTSESEVKAPSTAKWQIILFAVALVAIAAVSLCVVLTWQDAFWDEEDYLGDIFAPASESIMYLVENWKVSLFAVALTVAFTITLAIISAKTPDGTYLGAYKKFIIAIGFTAIAAQAILYVVIFVHCTPLVAMLYHITFGISVMLISQIVAVFSTCPYCGCYKTLEVVSSSTSKYYTGEYKTVSTTSIVVDGVEVDKVSEIAPVEATYTRTTYICKSCKKRVNHV